MTYYSVSEFADKIGISASTLRLWDKEGKLKPHHTSNGGKRFYSSEQLSNYLELQNSEALYDYDLHTFKNMSKEEQKKFMNKCYVDWVNMNEAVAKYNITFKKMFGILQGISNGFI